MHPFRRVVHDVLHRSLEMGHCGSASSKLQLSTKVVSAVSAQIAESTRHATLDGNTVADLEIDIFTHSNHLAHSFVAETEWLFDLNRPVLSVLIVVDIGAAECRCFDGDLHIIRSQ